ncbi:hypothetical protein OH76DRAFT_1183250 [Lentinus brumalis]|uniref:Uncharacterized protein n=1 Tax=Lentinus brumalis TaxID=2498619 RepID=A0A371CU23_9APHY|nr:hypothetical protein OH76DRAFT_1183250 [Polyporus brumalis]
MRQYVKSAPTSDAPNAASPAHREQLTRLQAERRRSPSTDHSGSLRRQVSPSASSRCSIDVPRTCMCDLDDKSVPRRERREAADHLRAPPVLPAQSIAEIAYDDSHQTRVGVGTGLPGRTLRSRRIGRVAGRDRRPY